MYLCNTSITLKTSVDFYWQQISKSNTKSFAKGSKAATIEVTRTQRPQFSSYFKRIKFGIIALTFITSGSTCLNVNQLRSSSGWAPKHSSFVRQLCLQSTGNVWKMVWPVSKSRKKSIQLSKKLLFLDHKRVLLGTIQSLNNSNKLSMMNRLSWTIKFRSKHFGIPSLVRKVFNTHCCSISQIAQPLFTDTMKQHPITLV
mgnify:CR=1 FL=1